MLKTNLLEDFKVRKVGTHGIEKSAKLVSGKCKRDKNVVMQLIDIAIVESKKAQIEASKFYRYKKL